MKPLTFEKLRSFSSEWLWICTDRVGEFDDLIGRPLKDVDFMKGRTKTYLDFKYTIDPDASDELDVTSFQELLLDLEAHGENVDRLYDWALCLSEELQPTNARSAVSYWERTFVRFAHGRREAAFRLDEDKLEEIILSYIENVLKPCVDLSQRQKESEALWLSSPDRRGDFDNILWECFFSEVNVDPAVYVVVGYREVRLREWWRKMRTNLSAEERAGLYAEQAALSIRPTPSIEDATLYDSAILDGFPVFEDVAFPVQPV
ncbi:MAG: hypothetical protein KAS66_07720 [Candidatus Omnitrophica bacterium]|nr:hypothetical protein [Candidatus Omnitrophota bacterium]